jgi:hypothetical protein
VYVPDETPLFIWPGAEAIAFTVVVRSTVNALENVLDDVVGVEPSKV